MTSLGMIACENCGVANMADNKFCRECGAHLAPPSETPRSEEDQKMVQDAQRLFAEFRYDEAAMVADAILEGDPYCIEALAIKGDCHERLGEYSQALECFKSIVAIDPDSQLDRIRVSRLEKLVASGDIEIGREAPRRRTAMAASVAAMLLLVSSGSALILAAQDGPSKAAGAEQQSREYQSAPFLPIPPVPSGNAGYAPNTQAAPQDTAFDDLRDAANTTSPMTSGGSVPRIGNGGGSLPQVPGSFINEGSHRVDPNDVQPVHPQPGGFTPQTPNRGGTADPDPTVVPNNQGAENRGMIVDVRPSPGSEQIGTNNVAEDRGARIDTLIRVARQQQVLGDFAKAATAYEEALKLGASPASTNQRLAQCYEKLNRKADAIKAYERAIQAFEKLDPNDVRVQAQLDSCRQALKLLRGA